MVPPMRGDCLTSKLFRLTDARMMTGLAQDAAEQKTIKIDATRFRTDRTASSLAVKKAAWSTDRAGFEGRKTVRGLFSRGRQA